jgi:hypothetical protein
MTNAGVYLRAAKQEHTRWQKAEIAALAATGMCAIELTSGQKAWQIPAEILVYP